MSKESVINDMSETFLISIWENSNSLLGLSLSFLERQFCLHALSSAPYFPMIDPSGPEFSCLKKYVCKENKGILFRLVGYLAESYYIFWEHALVLLNMPSVMIYNN